MNFKFSFSPVSNHFFEIITAIVFSEILTVVFTVFPSILLSSNAGVLTFYFLFFIYFIVSLVEPWIYVFFTDNLLKFPLIVISSSGGFIIIILINFFFNVPLQVGLYFILLKSFMAGLAAFLNTFFKSYLFQKPSLRMENFSFQPTSPLENDLASLALKKFKKYNIFGSITLLLIYPLVVLSCIYFYSIFT